MGCKQLSYYREATFAEETPFVAVHHGGKMKTLKKTSIGAITGSTGASNYEGAIRSSFGSRGSMISSLFSDQIDDSRPRAFINLMFLPQQSANSIARSHFAFAQVTRNSSNTHAALRLSEYEAPASGFIVIYLSNESRKLTEVYFDDLKITVQESKVVQRDDYYPFGLSFNSWKRSTARENKYLYQGKEKQDDLNLGTFDFHARMYDPFINRTWQLDPMSDAFDHLSPYSWVANNPLKFVDPTGMFIEETDQEKKKRELEERMKEMLKVNKSLWIPKTDDKGNVSYIAEKGDNVQTFAKQYNLDINQAANILSKNGLQVAALNDSGTPVEEGSIVSGESVKEVTGNDILKADINGSKQDAINQLGFSIRHSQAKGQYSFTLRTYFSNYNSSSTANPISGAGGITLRGKMNMNGTNVPVFVDMKGGWNLNTKNTPEGPKGVKGDTFINWEFRRPVRNGQPTFLIQVPNRNNYYYISGSYLYGK